MSELNRLLPLAAVALLLGAAACKPTEKNYREAYVAAKEGLYKPTEDMGAPILLQNDDWQIRVVGGDSVWVGLGRVSSDAVKDRCFTLAVADFRVVTNANSYARDLKARRHNAFVAGDGRDHWYVMVDTFPSVEAAARGARRFRDLNPSFRYIGVPAPVIFHL